MLSKKIRQNFIKYFVDKGHRHMPSSLVVPHDDPSLLFTNAGMNQFKSYLLGQEKAPMNRVVTSQKCVRVGGKHNDLENVGHTDRHLTFFEMLGNFSFGDYFKKEAIEFAWEVTSGVFEFDIDRVWVSVFDEDDEAYELWRKYVPQSRIVKIGAKDNFWSMGDVGPCGPCTELFLDRGAKYGNATSPADDVKGDRFFEFWNLVFMQSNRQHDGSLKDLPLQSVDTGAGLERVVTLKMEVETVFETDVLFALIQQCEETFKLKYYDQDPKRRAAFCVIADHLRMLSFAIADGVVPSNIDRGYILRKVLRRAVRYGRSLGAQKPFLASVLPTLIELMHEDFPELKKSNQKIAELLTSEEEAFFKTLKKGGNLLNSIMKKAEEDKSKEISGDDAFLLKDTYGLPLEEIQLMALDADLSVDTNRFGVLEKKAKEISRSAQKDVHQMASDPHFEKFVEEHGPVEFVGYDKEKVNTKIIALLHEGEFVDKLTQHQKGQVILKKTPFYAEMGGQVGDSGEITSENDAQFYVEDTQSPYSQMISHQGKLTKGELKVGDHVTAKINSERRAKIASNHTATHLLHWALVKVLGEHIRQAGSLVEPTRLRFDFSHHKALTKEQIIEIENLVNKKIRENLPVQIYELAFQEAQTRHDIKQFFGEKYGEFVRVIDIDYAKELCGGTHTTKVGNIGLFKITKESSIAAGVRRIEATTGEDAEEYYRQKDRMLEELSQSLKTTPTKLGEKLNQLIYDHRNLEEHINHLTKMRNSHLIDSLINQKKPIGELFLVSSIVDIPKKELRDFAFQLTEKSPSTICILASVEEGVVSIVVKMSDHLKASNISAKKILEEIISPIEGKGGGKDLFAQAGGSHPQNIPQVFEKARQYLQKLC